MKYRRERRHRGLTMLNYEHNCLASYSRRETPDLGPSPETTGLQSAW